VPCRFGFLRHRPFSEENFRDKIYTGKAVIKIRS
jgi:hypothetical protein